jgi:hypothetical protein
VGVDDAVVVARCKLGFPGGPLTLEEGDPFLERAVAKAKSCLSTTLIYLRAKRSCAPIDLAAAADESVRARDRRTRMANKAGSQLA